MSTIRVVSIHEPWAAAMAKRMPDSNPVKAIETRHWIINARCPFDLAIHAAKKKFMPAEWSPEFVNLCRDYRLLDDIVYGAIVCIVRVISIEKVDDLTNQNRVSYIERMFGNYVNEDENGDFQQRYGFVTDPKHLRVLNNPFYCRGFQKIWNWNILEGLEFK